MRIALRGRHRILFLLPFFLFIIYLFCFYIKFIRNLKFFSIYQQIWEKHLNDIQHGFRVNKYIAKCNEHVVLQHEYAGQTPYNSI